MKKRCNLKQIANAVILSAMDDNWNHSLVDKDNPGFLKSLDTFILTVYHFVSVFDKKFDRICGKYFHYKNPMSVEEFLNFLALGCETLSQKGDYFGLILTCSFASELLRDCRFRFVCLHFDSPSHKYFSEFLESRFKCLEDKSYWNSLIHYCKELNRKIYNRRKHRCHVPMEKSTTSASSGEDVEHQTDENNRSQKSGTIETSIINKLEYSYTNAEEVMNASEHFTDETGKGCDQMIAITQSKVISDAAQNNGIEKSKTQEINGKDIENISSSPIKEIDSLQDSTSSEDSSDDDNLPIIRQYYDLLMPDPAYKFEIFDLMIKCRRGFDHIFLNRFENKVINNQLDKDISSSSSTECKESDKSFESEKHDDISIDNREKIQTPVAEHESDSQSETKRCLECKSKCFKLRYEQWKVAFQVRYKNLSIVSDFFYEKDASDFSDCIESESP